MAAVAVAAMVPVAPRPLRRFAPGSVVTQAAVVAPVGSAVLWAAPAEPVEPDWPLAGVIGGWGALLGAGYGIGWAGTVLLPPSGDGGTP